MNEAPTAHRPKLIRTEYGFAVTDGLVSYPVDTFAEGRDLLKVATFEGMDAAGEELYGPYDYIEDEDGSEAYARMLERRAEGGTWFGIDRYEDGY
jgi:hypothetical protein